MSVLNDYNVNFFVTDYGRKRLSTKNKILTQFIGDHNSPLTATNLLSKINQVLSNQISSSEPSSLSMFVATVTATSSKLYTSFEDLDNNPSNPAFALPTNHFKIILEAWINYLENG